MAKLTSKPEIRINVLEKYNSKCAYCGCELTMRTPSIDHIEPLKRHVKECKAGLNVIENFNPCCKPCNSSKSSMDIETWRNELSLRTERLINNCNHVRLLKTLGIVEFKSGVKFYFEKI